MALRAVPDASPHFRSACRAQSGRFHTGARARGVHAGLFRIPPSLFVLLGARIQQELHRLPCEVAIFCVVSGEVGENSESISVYLAFMWLSTNCLAFSTAGPWYPVFSRDQAI